MPVFGDSGGDMRASVFHGRDDRAPFVFELWPAGAIRVMMEKIKYGVQTRVNDVLQIRKHGVFQIRVFLI